MLVTSYGGLAAMASGDIAKFNEDYAEIQELISNGQLREASEGALAAVLHLAEVVYKFRPGKSVLLIIITSLRSSRSSCPSSGEGFIICLKSYPLPKKQ